LYSAVPYQRDIGQFSSRDFVDGEYTCLSDIKIDEPLTKDKVK
jgi:hypothetical protein